MSTSGPDDLGSVLPGGEPRKPWPRAVRDWLHAAFVDNLAIKFVAFVLALTVFILVHSDEDATLRAFVGVSYSRLDDRVLVSERIDEVRITVRGSRRRIKRFSESDLENIHINLQNLSNGRFQFTRDMFDVPEGLQIVDIEPESLFLEFDERVDKDVPVIVDTTGSPARGYKVADIEVTPPVVTISGAKGALGRIESVRTQELELQGRSASFREPVSLVAEGFQLPKIDTVTVDVSLVEELEARPIENLEVAIRPGPGLTEQAAAGFRVAPEEVKVVLFGPYMAVQSIDADKIEVFVELEAGDVDDRKKRRADLRVEPKLPGIAYKISPSEVTLEPR